MKLAGTVDNRQFVLSRLFIFSGALCKLRIILFFFFNLHEIEFDTLIFIQINKQDLIGNTALHIACEHEQVRCQEGSKRLIANEVMLHSIIENNISYGNCDLIGWMLVLYLNYDEKLDLY